MGKYVEDPGSLKFSVRPDVRAQRRWSHRSTLHWWLLAVAGALVFLLVRGMLARGAETAGRSEEPSLVTQMQPSMEAPIADPVQPESTPMVYKCVGKGGAVSFQSDPCAEDQATRGAYAAPPDTWRDDEFAQLQQSDASRQASDMSRMAGTDGTATTTVLSSHYDQKRAECEAAKAHREQTLRIVGLARTYDLLQRLDEIVRESCKGT